MSNPSKLEVAMLFDPDLESGILIRKTTGKPVGSKTKSGYLNVGIGRRKYYVHRILWFIARGNWPAEIDHINGDPSDNRLSNLRAATHRQNGCNLKHSCRNTSGVKGVSLHQATGKWQAFIRTDGRNKFLGLFTGIDSARAARAKAEVEYYGEFSRK